jgi:hypothetical protein
MSWNSGNSLSGGYSGKSLGGLSGFSTFAPSYTTGPTTITPAVSHSCVGGSSNTFGAGIGVTHQITPSTSISGNVHSHGGNTTAGVGIGFKF